MANIKSQKKRALTNLKTRARKMGQRSELKTAIKNVLKAVESNDYAKANEALNHCNSLLDEAISSHNKHKNYVARQKSKLQMAVNKIKA